MTRLRSGTDRTFDPLDDTKLWPEEVFEPKKVGTLQLPVNSPKNATVATNQRDGQMTYFADTGGENPHVNYEPSTMGGLAEADPAAVGEGAEAAGEPREERSAGRGRQDHDAVRAQRARASHIILSNAQAAGPIRLSVPPPC